MQAIAERVRVRKSDGEAVAVVDVDAESDGGAARFVVDIIEETFVVAAPERVRPLVCDEARWRSWFPGIRLTSYDDRGPLGVRWSTSGDLVGTAEAWLEAHGDGTIVHVYLRGDPCGAHAHRLRRSDRRVTRRYVLPLKRHLLRVKDVLEAGRAPGMPLVPVGERVSSALEYPQGTRRPRPPLPTGMTSEGAGPDGRPDDLEHRDRR